MPPAKRPVSDRWTRRQETCASCRSAPCPAFAQVILNFGLCFRAKNDTILGLSFFPIAALHGELAMECVLVTGAGGFIGHHLVHRLKQQGYGVRGVDVKYPQFSRTAADEFIIGDLRDKSVARDVVRGATLVYQLAADMGGAGYIFTGDHDANIMHNSAMINLNLLETGRRAGIRNFFYSSSACIYPAYNQTNPANPKCSEDSAYPAAPDSEYGWEKLFSERLYLAFMRNHGIKVRIARLVRRLRKGAGGDLPQGGRSS